MITLSKQNLVYIRVNDIFDDLSEENKRLNNELMFANNCLKVLTEFKSLFNKICLKFEKSIDFEYKQELNRLENEFNSVINSREVFIKTDDENRDIVREIDENTNELKEELSENRVKNVSNETNVRRSGRTDRKVNAITVKRKLKSKTDDKNGGIVREMDENTNQLNEELSEDNPSLESSSNNEKNERRSRRTDRKRYESVFQ